MVWEALGFTEGVVTVDPGGLSLGRL